MVVSLLILSDVSLIMRHLFIANDNHMQREIISKKIYSQK